jgi:hypothetical protein
LIGGRYRAEGGGGSLNLALVFEQSSAKDEAAICALLGEAFQVGRDATLLEGRMLDWKYWQPYPGWDGSRSYVLRQGDGILAHAAVIPAVIDHAGTFRTALHFIDWAASPMSISGGAQLLRRITSLVDLTCAIGGAPATRKILPVFGFQPAGTVWTMALPLRPWRQMRTHQNRNWRLPVRMVRNSFWNWTRSRGTGQGQHPWTVERAAPEAIPETLWEAGGEGALRRKRTAASAAYFLSCPGADCRLYLAREGGQPQGCIVVACVKGQARIADLWVSEPDEDRYRAMYGLACQACYDFPEAAEAVGYAAIDSRLEAMKKSGFAPVKELPVGIFTRGSAAGGPVDWQMIDNDAAFLSGSSPAYYT